MMCYSVHVISFSILIQERITQIKVGMVNCRSQRLICKDHTEKMTIQTNIQLRIHVHN